MREAPVISDKDPKVLMRPRAIFVAVARVAGIGR